MSVVIAQSIPSQTCAWYPCPHIAPIQTCWAGDTAALKGGEALNSIQSPKKPPFAIGRKRSLTPVFTPWLRSRHPSKAFLREPPFGM